MASKAYFSADDSVKPFKRACKMPKAPKGRKCIESGSVLILLSGRFRGKRVICLKTLKSGLVLVTGPYKVNGVPLKRVNPAYVIPTSYKVNVSGCDVSKIDDSFFDKTKCKKGKKDENGFFDNTVEMSSEEKAKIDNKKSTQKSVDAKLLEAVKKTEHLKGYLNTRFTLRNNMRFHEISF